jgi:addiction module HigA family antidote
MAKEQSPSGVFKSYLDQYNLTAAKVAEDIKLSQSSIRLLIGGKLKISIPIAIRLSKYFGTRPEYWIDLQTNHELAETFKNPKLAAIFKGISRAKKMETKTKSPLRRTSRTGKPAAKKPAAKKPAGRTGAAKPRASK